jgi:hypothetical protein
MKKALKLELLGMDLASLNFFRTKEKPEKRIMVEVARQTDINILEIQGNTVKVCLSEKIFFKPTGPFKIDLELEGRFQIEGMEGEINANEISSEEIENAARPLFAKASHIIGFISDQILGVPLIIPPFKED